MTLGARKRRSSKTTKKEGRRAHHLRPGEGRDGKSITPGSEHREGDYQAKLHWGGENAGRKKKGGDKLPLAISKKEEKESEIGQGIAGPVFQRDDGEPNGSRQEITDHRRGAEGGGGESKLPKTQRWTY